MWRDLRASVRALARSPGHLATAVLCLTVGIVASASAFSIVNALFYRAMPGIADRDALRRVHLIPAGPVSYAQSATTIDARTLTARPFATVAVASEGEINASAILDGAPVNVVAAFVSGSYFDTLGTRAERGRLLTPTDDRFEAPAVAVVSDLFWRRSLAERVDAVGSMLTIGRRSVTVVGIAPEGFSGFEMSEIGQGAGSRVQIWLPLAAAAGWPGAPALDEPWHSLAIRPRAGSSLEAARAELEAAVGGLAGDGEARPVAITIGPLAAGPNDVPMDVAIAISAFLAVPLLVLAIACANVANLQLARATDRAREVAVRLALGATRFQIARLLAIDVLLIGSLAGAGGLVGTMAVMHAARSFLPLPLAVDWAVVGFAMALVVVVIAVAGLAPAWLATRSALAAGARGHLSPPHREYSRLRSGLVAAQIALSLALLLTSGLFARSLQHIYRSVPPVTSELVVGRVELVQSGYDAAQTRAFLDDLVARLGADSRVTHVAAATYSGFRYAASDAMEGGERIAIAGAVTPSWFAAMDVRPIAGRVLDSRDGPAAVVVNERVARELVPDGLAVGHLIRLRSPGTETPRTAEVVGVIPELRRPPDPQVDRMIYFRMPAVPERSLHFILRTPAPAAVIPVARRALAAIDPALPWADLTTGEDAIDRDMSPVRYLVLSIGGLGALALVLAAAGLYAVMSYAVTLRRREIGVRLAIGARPADVVRMVLTQAARTVAIGTVAGLGLALPALSAVRFLFFGLSPLDQTAIGGTVGILAVTTLIAAVIPARRAALVDPVRALRDD